ncbi:MAG TPA: monothiol glutaredoxin, Grx4 family, partial [Solirubrobacteraceae bacterium]
FVDGELVGGCDIVTEMYQSGELQEVLGTDAGSSEEPVQESEVAEAPPISIENRL